MSHADHLADPVAVEGSPASYTDGPLYSTVTTTGHVIIESSTNGNWQADCTRCGAGCGAAGSDTIADELDTDGLDYEDRMLEHFTAEHRDCTLPVDGDATALPSPSAMPPDCGRKPTAWVVKQASGGEVRVLAERHTTFARPEGTELRFHDGDGDAAHRVATVRAGSWHWVIAESALNPGAGGQQ